MSDNDNRTRETETETEMRRVSHTNPYTNETLGDTFRRGPAVTDGGERRDEDAMANVDHTPREGDGANAVWNRGRGDSDE
ncbi:hypothetical protein [Halogeometricum limi]|uniref:Uncharacterized protein n=1 Tax=Halogeometricum limi TaxID=555875 RepID=A0A1I6GH02_9EURY|nr:hypothetical protein [Halogeometricum limi]SFR41475.1 hypothetical protein SAMN04488124_1031 [Halogeometricum limi]